MTPTELETSSRQRYNAVGDNFWTQAEIFGLIYKAEMELALETSCIHARYSTVSVNGTDEIAMPTTAIGIRRLYYNNRPLEPISLEDREMALGNNDPSDVTGTPDSYALDGNVIYLVKTPNTDGLAIKIWTYDEPTLCTAVSTLATPSRYHNYIIDFILYNFYSKDKRYDLAQFQLDLWKAGKNQAMVFEAKRRRSDKLPRQSMDYSAYRSRGL